MVCFSSCFHNFPGHFDFPHLLHHCAFYNFAPLPLAYSVLSFTCILPVYSHSYNFCYFCNEISSFSLFWHNFFTRQMNCVRFMKRFELYEPPSATFHAATAIRKHTRRKKNTTYNCVCFQIFRFMLIVCTHCLRQAPNNKFIFLFQFRFSLVFIHFFRTSVFLLQMLYFISIYFMPFIVTLCALFQVAVAIAAKGSLFGTTIIRVIVKIKC